MKARKTKFRRVSSTATLAAALMSVYGAYAQEKTVDSGDRLQEVTVTAQRVKQKLQDVPASVTAFSPEAIERMQIQSVVDLTRLAPNVKFDPITGGSTAAKPYIRGGGVVDGGQITSESEVGMYVDDVYRARLSAAIMDFVELDRIEVLRGPQGVLYGRNSSGGAVNIITRAPGESFAGSVEAGYGTWNDVRLKGFVTGPLSEDKRWRASIQGMMRDRDGGRQHNVTLNKDVGEMKVNGVQADVAYVSDNLEGRLSVFTMHTTGDGQWSVPNTVSPDGKTITPTTGSYRKVASPIESYTNVRQDGVTFKLSANASGTRYTSITGYSRLRDGWRQDFSGGVAASLLGIPGGGTVALFDRVSQTDQHQFTQELQAAGNLFSGKVDYVGGLYYFDETGQQDITTNLFFTPSRTIFSPDTKSYAAFGQLTTHVTNQLALILGGRYTKDEKRIKGSYNNASFEMANDYSRFTPKFGIDYKIMPNVLVYASYSEGFKSGGYNGLAGSVSQIQSPFQPQLTKAYEAGIKSDLFDRKLRLNAALFLNDIKNRQQTLTVTSGPNIGSFAVENYNAEVSGLELEATWRVMKGLSIWANAAFNDSKYKSCTTLAVACSIINNKLPIVPEYSYAVGFDYDRKIGDGTLKLGADYSKRDQYYSTPDNVLIGTIPSQDFLNAYVGYDIGNWSYQLSGKNLLQEKGWQTGFGFALVQPRISIEPRTLLATVRYRF